MLPGVTQIKRRLNEGRAIEPGRAERYIRALEAARYPYPGRDHIAFAWQHLALNVAAEYEMVAGRRCRHPVAHPRQPFVGPDEVARFAECPAQRSQRMPAQGFGPRQHVALWLGPLPRRPLPIARRGCRQGHEPPHLASETH